MRHLFAILLLSLGLAACDDSTTAPTDTIPGPPNAPRLTLTVLTGTKAAPVDSPTVKVEWAFADSVDVGAGFGGVFGYSSVNYVLANVRFSGIGAYTVKAGCGGNDSAKVSAVIQSAKRNSAFAVDSVIIHCK